MAKKSGGKGTSSVTKDLLEKLGIALNVPGMVKGASYLGRDNRGRAMYSVTYQEPVVAGGGYRTNAMRRTTVAYSAGQIYTPEVARVAKPGSIYSTSKQSVDAQAGNSEILALKSAKQEVLGMIAEHFNKFSAGDIATMKRRINGWTGSSSALLRYGQLILNDVIHAPTQYQDTIYVDSGDEHDDGGGGGGLFDGGYGGLVEPEYRAPDRRVVEDFVRGVQVSLVGSVSDAETKRLADLYMKDHKRNWEATAADIDPSQSVTEAVRQTDRYKTIHKLRPDGADERTWIAERRGAGAQGGLAEGELDDFAVDQATVGGSGEDVVQAGAVRQFQNSGQAPAYLDQQFRSVARGMLAAVK